MSQNLGSSIEVKSQAKSCAALPKILASQEPAKQYDVNFAKGSITKGSMVDLFSCESEAQ